MKTIAENNIFPKKFTFDFILSLLIVFTASFLREQNAELFANVFDE